MRRLIISTAMTVDGVMSVEDWYVPEGGHDRAGMEQFQHAKAMLLGSKNFGCLAAFWSPMTGEWADLLNPMPKFVASRALRGAADVERHPTAAPPPWPATGQLCERGDSNPHALRAPAPKAGASANSATLAGGHRIHDWVEIVLRV